VLTFDPETHGARYSPEYGSARLSDHLPMACHALACLGASEERVQAFAGNSLARLVPVTGSGQGRGVLPTSCFGTRGCYAAFRSTIAESIRCRGSHEVLRELLPRLLPGIATAAFHGLIRTAYGIDSGCEPEIAAGLAYWADAFEPVAIDIEDEGAISLASSASHQLLDATRQFARLKKDDPQGNSIHAQMLSLLGDAEVRAILSRCRLGDTQDLADIAHAALAVFFATDGDFTALHCVTGTHAARIIAPYVDDKRALYHHLWTGIVLAYLTTGKADLGRLQAILDRTAGGGPETWETLREAAQASSDAHDIKFVFTCEREAQAYGNPHYLEAATLQMR